MCCCTLFIYLNVIQLGVLDDTACWRDAGAAVAYDVYGLDKEANRKRHAWGKKLAKDSLTDRGK
jgi:hypothetical protein